MAWAACAVIGMQFISLVGRMVMHDESADASWFNTAFYLLAAVLVCRAKGNVAKILQVDWWLAVDAPPGANGSTNGQAFLNSAVIKQADILNLVITGGRSTSDPINIKDPGALRVFVESIIIHENGGNPYKAEVIDEGVRRALT